MKFTALITSLIMLLHAAALFAQNHHPPASQTVTFSTPIFSATPDFYLYQIASGDINNDGFPDVAVLNIIIGVAPTYSLGTGNGLFPTWNYAPSPLGPAWVELADVNGDGNLDILTSDYLGGTMTIGFGDGYGNFPSSEVLPSAYFLGPFTVADLNNDGIPDIIGLFPSGPIGYPGGVNVALGAGNGQFQPEMHFGSGGFEPWALAVADLNHDGIPDVVVINIGDYSNNRRPYGSVTVLLGRGDGRFRPPERYFVGHNPSSVALADFNGDGNLDIAVTADAGVSVLLGKGDGTFSSHAPVFAGRYARSIMAADFNGDGKADLALITGVTGQFLTLLLGNGDGTFQSPQYFPTGQNSYQAVVADFNADGKPDIATIDSSSNTGNISVLLNTTP